MPKMNRDIFFWSNVGNSERQKDMFHYMMHDLHNSNLPDWLLGNTTYELEAKTLFYTPKLLPIGPLLKSHQTKKSLGQFWEEDLSCLHWLDQQPHCSVIYVAFGSTTKLKFKQFDELALGLDLINRPFLWVVRPNTYGSIGSLCPNEFSGKNGKIVKWAPQQQVLSHPAIACFISHCGWNSTMEGVCNGVPFLCWPYFADQFLDMHYICNEWKVGLGFEKDEEGVVSRWEIKKKVELLLDDGDIKARSLKLKEVVMKNTVEGGRSLENFNKFVKWVKE